MKIALVSDTHNMMDKVLPFVGEVDMFIHAGDFTNLGSREEVIKFSTQLRRVQAKYKIVIAGNHELILDGGMKAHLLLPKKTIYLENSGAIIEGLKIWGSPMTPRFFDWAFLRDRGKDIKRYWDIIPDDLDFLITHGPPHGVLDEPEPGLHVGCEELKKRVKKAMPKFHVFGHVHPSRGTVLYRSVMYMNVAAVNRLGYLREDPVTFLELT